MSGDRGAANRRQGNTLFDNQIEFNKQIDRQINQSVDSNK